MSEYPSGQPDVLLAPNMNKIDIPLVRANVEKHKFNMSGGDTQYRWWLRFLKELGEIKEDRNRLEQYSSRGAFWLLPFLLNRQRKRTNTKCKIADHLVELIDKELDEHKASILSY